MTHLGRYIAYLRRNSREKLSARQLAQRVGCSNTYIGQVEKGRQLPSIELTWDIVSKLGGNGRYAVVALLVDHGIPESEVTPMCPEWGAIEAAVNSFL